MKNTHSIIGQFVRYILLVVGVIIFESCAINNSQSFYDFEPVLPEPAPPPKQLKDYQVFLNVIQLGHDAVNSESFKSVINNLQKKLATLEYQQSRLFNSKLAKLYRKFKSSKFSYCFSRYGRVKKSKYVC